MVITLVAGLVDLRSKEDNLVLQEVWVVLKWEWVVKVTMVVIMEVPVALVVWVEAALEVLEEWAVDLKAVAEALEAGRRSCCFSLSNSHQNLLVMSTH